jgi:hypothetical protein
MVELEYQKYSKQRLGGTGLRAGEKWVVDSSSRAVGLVLGLQRNPTAEEVMRLCWQEESKNMVAGGMGGVKREDDIKVRVHFGSVQLKLDLFKTSQSMLTSRERFIHEKLTSYNLLSDRLRQLKIEDYIVNLTFYDFINCFNIEIYTSVYNQLHRINSFLLFF